MIKKLLIVFSIGFSCRVGYADTKISAMPSTTTLNNLDIIPVVTTGSAANFSITKANLSSTLDILTQSSSTVNFIKLASALQSGATFYVSSGTVLGVLSASSITTTGRIATATDFAINNSPVLSIGGATSSVFGGNGLTGAAAINTACFGVGACPSITSAGANDAMFGHNAGLGLTTGDHNTCVGHSACETISTADQNTAVGSNALYSVTSGAGNVAIGYTTGQLISTGSNDTLVGGSAGKAITTGVNNTTVGTSAGVGITIGTANTCLGETSCGGITAGSSNTFVGAENNNAGNQSANTIIGYGAGANTGVTGAACIGYNCFVSSSNTMQLGGAGVDSVRVIGSTFTFSSGTVSSQFTMGTAQGAGLVTCGDSTHALSWSAGSFGCQNVTGSGGGGGSSSLETIFGNARSSPTATLGGVAGQFTGVVTGSSMTIGIDGSSITMRGTQWGYNVDTSTNSIQTVLNAVAASTAGTLGRLNNLDTSTGTINTQIGTLGASTGTLNGLIATVGASTGTLRTDMNAGFSNVAVSTLATLGRLNNLDSSTGTITGTRFPVSLSTGIVGVLPAANIVSTAAYTTSTNTWTGHNYFNQTVSISSSVARITQIEWADGTVQTSSPTVGSSGGGMTPGNTDYVQVRATLQSGATFYVSSGTVDKTLYINGTGQSSVTPVFQVVNSTFSISADGSVSIGSVPSSRTARLLVVNSGNTLPSNNSPSLTVEDNGTSTTGNSISVIAGTGALAGIDFGDSTSSNRGGVYFNNATGILNFRSSLASNRITIDGSGNTIIAGSTTVNAAVGILNTSSLISLNISTAPSGVSQLSVSSSPAVLATDFVMTISSTAGTLLLGIQNNSHVISSGTTPVASSCGSSPILKGTDFAFTVTPGATATGCTITFSSPYANDPTCQVNQQSMSLVNSLTYTHSQTAVVITQSGASSNVYDVVCIGNKG